jgi:hypothetical protein
MNVRENIEGNFITFSCFTGCHQSDQWGLQSLQNLFVEVFVIFGQMKEHFYCAQDNRRTCVLKSVFQKIHDVKLFLLVLWLVLGCDVQNDTLPPLVEIFNSIQKWNNQASVNIEATFVSLNFIYSLNGVDYDQWVGIFS